jgi:hypothetical protein
MIGRIVPENVIDDRHQVGQALARPRAGRDEIGLVVLGGRDCFGLVPIKPEVGTEESRGVLADHALGSEVRKRAGRFISRIELQHGVGPQLAAR